MVCKPGSAHPFSGIFALSSGMRQMGGILGQIKRKQNGKYSCPQGLSLVKDMTSRSLMYCWQFEPSLASWAEPQTLNFMVFSLVM